MCSVLSRNGEPQWAEEAIRTGLRQFRRAGLKRILKYPKKFLLNGSIDEIVNGKTRY